MRLEALGDVFEPTGGWDAEAEKRMQVAPKEGGHDRRQGS